MSGYVPKPALPNTPKGYRNSGVEPVDIHAQRWAEYPDLPTKEDAKPNSLGCVFAKSCDLPDGVIDHKKPAGFIPVEKVGNYGEFAILGGRDTDAQGNTPLKKISGAIPATLGTLLLGGAATSAAGVSCGGLCVAGAAVATGSTATGASAAGGAGLVTAGVVAGALAGVLQCFGRRVLATVAFIQKNSSSRLKKDVHVSD